MISIIIQIFAVIGISYVIGSIPTGYIIVKHFKGDDIRRTGSGSTGATNVKRVMGKKWFFITLFLDMLKGMIPVLLIINYTDNFLFFPQFQSCLVTANRFS